MEETLALITLLVNGGSVCLIKASMVIAAPALVLMVSRRASRSLIFCEVKLSQRLGAWSSRRGDFPPRLISSPSISGVRLDDWNFDKEELR